jgi:hypothetical protein
MGGLAFADEKPPLHTPRMPPTIYVCVRDQLLSKLRTFYAQAECPIEAPGRADHGDIDILVAGPLHEFDSGQVAAAVGAVKHKKPPGSQTTHFAVPWPKLEDLSHEESVVDEESVAILAGNEEKYIQLDLHQCTPSSIAWEVFNHAHGDFWSIIGSGVRRLGLTPSSTGFYVRIEEIEARNKNAARILLTNQPSETLKFLGLDEARYWQKFETTDELFAYAATCRFFNPRRYDPVKTKADLKANDRARARKRAMFRKWIEEYLPAHCTDHPADAIAANMSREEVVEKAKSWFGIAEDYDERRRKGVQEMSRDRMWTQIRKELDIDGESIGAVMRGVKRLVIVEEGQQEADMTIHQGAYAEDDFDTIVDWARANWKEIEDMQRAYEKERSTQNLLAKLETMKAEGKADDSTRLGEPRKEVAEGEDCREMNGVLDGSS